MPATATARAAAPTTSYNVFANSNAANNTNDTAAAANTDDYGKTHAFSITQAHDNYQTYAADSYAGANTVAAIHTDRDADSAS